MRQNLGIEKQPSVFYPRWGSGFLPSFVEIQPSKDQLSSVLEPVDVCNARIFAWVEVSNSTTGFLDITMDFSRIFPPALRSFGDQMPPNGAICAMVFQPRSAGGTAALDGPWRGDLGTLSDGRRRNLVPFLRARHRQSFCTALAARTDA